MTYEAVILTRTGNAIPFTVANGTGIEKGALCTLTDLMTATLASVSGSLFAGITASEKIANNGIIKLGLYREGIFRVYASGSGNVGDALTTAGVNHVKVIGNVASGSRIVGIALETFTDSETFKMELRPGCKLFHT